MVTSRVGALSAFTTKKQTCLGCKAVLPAGQDHQPLCKHCLPNQAKLYMNELNKYVLTISLE